MCCTLTELELREGGVCSSIFEQVLKGTPPPLFTGGGDEGCLLATVLRKCCLAVLSVFSRVQSEQYQGQFSSSCTNIHSSISNRVLGFIIQFLHLPDIQLPDLCYRFSEFIRSTMEEAPWRKLIVFS